MAVRLKVAVADDERDTREFLEEFLARLGHDVRTAADGRGLVELCRAFAPDVVVTDYAMPGMTGPAAAAEVNRERPVPVILLSGRHDAEDGLTADANVVMVLSKPVRSGALRAAVEAAAGGELRPVVVEGP